MYHYFNNCVGWPQDDVWVDGGLHDMIEDNQEVTRRTFLQHVSRRDLTSLENGLGYSRHHTQGLTMAADWAVSYHRSKLHGERVYYFRWSSIEYVFTNNERRV